MTLPATTVQTLSVLLVLLPGFLCAGIVQTLCVRPEQSNMDKVVQALIYSFLIYVIFAATIGPFDLRQSQHLLIITFYSVAIGLLLSAAITNDWTGKALRRCRITHRTSNTSVWNDVFHSLGGYLLVELSDRRLVAGWVRYFSDREDTPSLFLEDAAWVERENGREIPITGPGIFLTRYSGISSIAFLTPRTVEDQSGKPEPGNQ